MVWELLRGRHTFAKIEDSRLVSSSGWQRDSIGNRFLTSSFSTGYILQASSELSLDGRWRVLIFRENESPLMLGVLQTGRYVPWKTVHPVQIFISELTLPKPLRTLKHFGG